MFKRLRETWGMLNRSIYRGERLEQNLRALTYVSMVTAALGLLLTITNLISGEKIMLLAAVNTMLGGLGCWYCAGVLKNREAAAVIPTTFCAIVFTIYTVFGLGHGTAMLWSILMPIGLCYFVSVKYGIILSTYYSLMFLVVFYTPLQARMAQYYSEAFMLRFPLLFLTLTLFTAIAMIQYHRVSLVELDYQDELSREVEEQTHVAKERAASLETLSREIVETLAVTIDAKDRYTNGHSFRVARYSTALAGKLGWGEEDIKMLGGEALLHDIGKIGVPDAVLNKPGRLTDEEFKIIQSHTLVGDTILKQSGSLTDTALVARHHHERYDGHGYPDGLKGESIPLHARLAAIADSYDAMRSDRIYRKGLPEDVIRSEMIKGRGTQFDPKLLDEFMQLMDTSILNEIAESDVFRWSEPESA